MKIKSVRYERLFNVGEYQNETIGFIADVDAKEKPETALGKLYDMVTTANKSCNRLREIAYRLHCLQREDGYYCSSIYYSKREIERLEQKIKELKDTSGDNLELLQNYFDRLKKEKVELERKLKDEKELTKNYQDMLDDFKKGVMR